MLKFARETMRYLETRTIDVVDRLNQTYKPESTEYRTIIERLLGFGQPWLDDPTHLVKKGEILRNRTYGYWLVRAGKGDDTHNTFETALQNSSDKGRKIKLVDGTPDRVYMASEICGFPLMAVPNLNRYRDDAYIPFLEKDEVLHTDLAFEKFKDLLLKKEPEEVDAYLGSLEVFLDATLLGVIKGEPREGHSGHDVLLDFIYYDTSGLRPKPIKLGPFSVAVARLSKSRNENLLEKIRSISQEIKANQGAEEDAQWCALLAFHAEGSEDSYFHRFPEEHIVRVLLSQKSEMFFESYSEIQQEAVKDESKNLAQWAKESPINSGLFILM